MHFVAFTIFTNSYEVFTSVMHGIAALASASILSASAQSFSYRGWLPQAAAEAQLDIRNVDRVRDRMRLDNVSHVCTKPNQY